MKSRRERRAEARKNKIEFQPQYSSGTRVDRNGDKYTVGGNPRTHEEIYGVGNERFNNKYVTIKEESKEEVVEESKE